MFFELLSQSAETGLSFMNICLRRVEHYCIVILKGRSVLKHLPTAITCENFSHVADLLCRKKKPDTESIQVCFFLNSGHKTKPKNGKEMNQCLKTEKVHGPFHAVEST